MSIFNSGLCDAYLNYVICCMPVREYSWALNSQALSWNTALSIVICRGLCNGTWYNKHWWKPICSYVVPLLNMFGLFYPCCYLVHIILLIIQSLALCFLIPWSIANVGSISSHDTVILLDLLMQTHVMFLLYTNRFMSTTHLFVRPVV